MATTHLNGVNVSPHSLTNLLKDNDHLEIDLTDNDYDDRVLSQAHERDEDAEHELHVEGAILDCPEDLSRNTSKSTHLE